MNNCINDIDLLMIASIKNCANSLLEQLKEYDFLYITPEQSKELNNIEILMHSLLNDITNIRA
jgi:hypothetical protein